MRGVVSLTFQNGMQWLSQSCQRWTTAKRQKQGPTHCYSFRISWWTGTNKNVQCLIKRKKGKIINKRGEGLGTHIHAAKSFCVPLHINREKNKQVCLGSNILPPVTQWQGIRYRRPQSAQLKAEFLSTNLHKRAMAAHTTVHCSFTHAAAANKISWNCEH